MRVSTWKIRLTAVFGAVLYVFILLLVYAIQVAPIFTYMGYSYFPPGALSISICGVASVSPSIFLPLRAERPSTLAIWAIYLFVFVPSIVIPVVSLNKPILEFAMLQSSLLGAMWILIYFSKKPILAIIAPKFKTMIFIFCVLSLSIIFYILIIVVAGIKFNLLAFIDEYLVRDSFNDSLNSAPLIAYTLTWLGDVINPMLLVIGISRRNRTLKVFAILGQLFIFTQTGHKSVAFSIFIIYIGAYLLDYFRDKIALSMVLGTSLFILICWLIDALTETPLATSIFVRRAIITPGLLTGFYWDFFSKHEIVLYAHSFTKAFLSYPYSLNPPFLIGYNYFDSATMSANANFLADGFANLGYIGILFHAAILGLVFYLYDCISTKIGIKPATLLLFVPALGVVNSALFTCLLTGGLGLLLIMVLLMPASVMGNDRRLDAECIGGDSK